MKKKVNDWRAIGVRLYEKFRKDAEQEVEKSRERLAAIREARPTDGDIFQSAIIHAIAWGDLDRLICFLGSDRQAYLPRSNRDDLAYILSDTPWKQKRGRSKNHTVRRLAADADKFYKEWRSALEEAGISIWRLSNEMRDEACRYAVECWNSLDYYVKVDFETVRQMMDRSKTRQK
jgi:hypothetical protein